MAADAHDGAVSSSSPAPKTRKLSPGQSVIAAPRRMSDPKGKGKALNMDNGDEMNNNSPKSCYESDDDESMHCAICLSVIDERTVLQPCNHGVLQPF